MATQLYPSVPVKELADDLASDGTTVKVTEILDWGGNALTTAHFPVDYIPATLINDAQTLAEFILIDATTIANGATTGLTIFKRGLNYYATGVQATDQTEVTANKLDWKAGETKLLLGTHTPYMFGTFVNRFNDETISGTYTFDVTAFPRMSASGTNPVNAYDLVTKEYADALTMSGTGVTNAAVVFNGLAGETVAAGELLYFDTTQTEWMKCDADTATTVEQVLLGIAQGAGTDGNAITGGVLIAGFDENQSGMTQGEPMYAGNTAGAIANSPGTTERMIGIARSATQLYFNPYFFHMIKEVDKDKLEAVTASASEINQLDGATISAAQLTEAGTFFGATDISGAEAETLTDGSVADSLHYHTGIPGLGADNWFTFTSTPSIQSVDTDGGWSTPWGGGIFKFTASGATWDSRQYLPSKIGSSTNPAQWNSTLDMIFQFGTIISGTTGDRFWGLGDGTAMSEAYNGVSRKIAFVADGGTLYAATADGTTATTTDISAGITLTNFNVFKIVVNPGVDVKFYVNGTLKATHTTNIPSDANTFLMGIGGETISEITYITPWTVSLQLA